MNSTSRTTGLILDVYVVINLSALCWYFKKRNNNNVLKLFDKMPERRFFFACRTLKLIYGKFIVVYWERWFGFSALEYAIGVLGVCACLAASIYSSWPFG